MGLMIASVRSSSVLVDLAGVQGLVTAGQCAHELANAAHLARLTDDLEKVIEVEVARARRSASASISRSWISMARSMTETTSPMPRMRLPCGRGGRSPESPTLASRDELDGLTRDLEDEGRHRHGRRHPSST